MILGTRMPFSFFMRFVIALGILVICPIPVAPASSQEKPPVPAGLERLADNPDYSDVSTLPNVHVELRYASENNFLGKNLYGDFHRCFLHRVAAEKFRRAARALVEKRPGWRLLVFDCLRPRSLQEKLFAAVKGTPRQQYVANPRSGSVHNYGFAIDLSLEDEQGREIDMGTGFDDFT